MSVKNAADTGTNLNDSFGGGEISVDTGAADDWQNQEVEAPAQEAAPEGGEEAPAVETEPAPETQTDEPAVAAPTPSPSQVQATPPQEPPPWFEPVMAPITGYFKQQSELLRAGMERKALQDQAANRKQIADARIAAREAARPVAPDPNTATVKQLNEYAQNLAKWHADAAREDAVEGLRGEFESIQSKMNEIVEFNRAQALTAQAKANEQYIVGSLESIAADPRYPFMANKEVQDLFLGQWWAMNNAAGGKIIPAGEAFSRFVKMISVVTGQKTVAANARAGQEAVDKNRRQEQEKRGVPAAPRAGAPSTKDNNSGGSIGDKSWWESGALH